MTVSAPEPKRIAIGPSPTRIPTQVHVTTHFRRSDQALTVFSGRDGAPGDRPEKPYWHGARGACDIKMEIRRQSVGIPGSLRSDGSEESCEGRNRRWHLSFWSSGGKELRLHLPQLHMRKIAQQEGLPRAL